MEEGSRMDILRGIKVVDVTMWAFVPSAGGVLAHWGADVVKVESPTSPDPMRMMGGSLEPGGSSNLFKHYSRGKRSIALDLASDEGREILYKLVADADVFLTSFLPPTRKKLKIDVDDIRKVNPKIIYARGTGQGPKGPEAERGGYDGVTWWGRGTLSKSAMDVTGATWPVSMIGHGDGMSGMTLVSGILAALLRRERTGTSTIVDASLLGTAIWFNGLAIVASQNGAGGTPPPAGTVASTPVDHGSSVPEVVKATPPPGRENSLANMGPYQTKDGRFLILGFLGDSDVEWVDLCQHLERPDLATDPRFSTSASRMVNHKELMAILDEVFDGKTLAEWKKALLTARGVWAPVQSPAEVYDDPQTLANGFLRYVDYPGGGLKVPVPPILFDEEAGDPPPAPDFGAHTDEVLSALGISDDEVARLRAAGTVA
jgi:crotonobetainyl-CoA:carnitine CoA-transferase CaiB-like acyl-CoA transferase